MWRKALGIASVLSTSAYLNCTHIPEVPLNINDPEHFVLFSGNSNRQLTEEIAGYLDVKIGNAIISRFADGEVRIQVLDNVRGKDTYIVQSTCLPVNENLMELLLMVSTLRRASAKKITAVIPYYGYARQDRKMSSRVPISSADVARLLETMGVDRVISCDLHCGQIQGFFGPNVPVDNLEASIVALEFMKQLELKDPIIVSPDAGGVYRAKKFQEFMITEGMNPGLAMIIKQRVKAGEISKMDLVGSVEGSDVIIVDDIIDTGGTLCEAAHELKKYGAKRVYAFATHGLFSKDAREKIENSPLELVVVTNTIPLRSETIPGQMPLNRDLSGCDRINQISVGRLLATAIYRSHYKKSISQLFYPNNQVQEQRFSQNF